MQQKTGQNGSFTLANTYVPGDVTQNSIRFFV